MPEGTMTTEEAGAKQQSDSLDTLAKEAEQLRTRLNSERRKLNDIPSMIMKFVVDELIFYFF